MENFYFIGMVALKAGFIAGVAWIGTKIPNVSASRRHVIWLAAIAGSLVLPAAVLFIPQWSVRLPAPPTVRSPSADALVQTTPVAAKHYPAPASMLPVSDILNILAFSILMSGALFHTLRLLHGLNRAHMLRRNATPAPEDWSRSAGLDSLELPVLVSHRIRIPILVGFWNPVIVLPAIAQHWTANQLRCALLHEQAHFHRRDHLVLPFVEVARILYWWHPAVLLAIRNLREEQERACDDLVTETKIRASEYAELLLQICRAASVRSLPVLDLAMARGTKIGDRVDALLDPNRSRQRAGVSWRCSAIALALVITVALSAIGIGTTARGAQPVAPAKPKEAVPGTRLITKEYSVPADWIPEGQPARTFLEKAGIAFHAGAQAVFVKEGSRLVVRNTQEQLDAVDLLVAKAMGVSPRLIDIAANKLSEAEIRLAREEKLLEVGPPSAAVLDQRKILVEQLQKLLEGDNIPRAEYDKALAEYHTLESKVATEQLNLVGNVQKAETEYRLAENARMAAQLLEDPVDRIILPLVRLQDATPTEAFEFLQRDSKKQDPRRQGINLVIKDANPNARVNLNLTDIPVREAVRYVAALCGAEATVLDAAP